MIHLSETFAGSAIIDPCLWKELESLTNGIIGDLELDLLLLRQFPFSPLQEPFLNNLQSCSLVRRQWRTSASPQNIFEHVTRTKEVGPAFQEADGSFHRIGVTCLYPLKRTTIATRKREIRVVRVELGARLLPLKPLLCAFLPMAHCFVNARIQAHNLRSISADLLPYTFRVHETLDALRLIRPDSEHAV